VRLRPLHPSSCGAEGRAFVGVVVVTNFARDVAALATVLLTLGLCAFKVVDGSLKMAIDEVARFVVVEEEEVYVVVQPYKRPGCPRRRRRSCTLKSTTTTTTTTATT
jgi:hypothetical protein